MNPPFRSRRNRLRLSLVLVVLGWLLLATGARAAGPEVVLLPTTGIVDEGMQKYLADHIELAASEGASAVVVKLNTPGGSLFATYAIVGTIMEADIPVIVWVAPSGGFAASAGTFITLAGHIALMAPSTTIGAASPVTAEGGDIQGTEAEKVRQEVTAKIKGIAEARGRNVEWAIEAVQDARASSASEAVELGVVDGMAASIDEVLAFADGRTVMVNGQPVTLDLAGATVSERTMNPLLAFIRLLSDPNIALLLLSVGSAGLLAEVWSPNFVTGILGGLALILGLIGLGSLPLNVGGLLLLLFGLLLFGLELTVTSHGLLGVGGLVCFALGASALFTGPTDPFAPAIQVAGPVLTVTVATFAVLLVAVVYGVVRSRRVSMAVAGGATIQAGVAGEVRSPLLPLGTITAAGEEWTARTADGSPLQRGTPVRVVAVDGLTLTVEPDPSAEQP